MKDRSLWHSTIKLFIVATLYFIMSGFLMSERAPSILIYKVYFLIASSVGLILLLTRFKKSSANLIGSFYLVEVIMVLISIGINHNHYVQNFERFQPYLAVKLLALFIALSASSLHWVGWTALSITTAMPILQYLSWPEVYRAQLGIQEPAMTVGFSIVAAALFVNRLHTIELLKKEAASSEKLAIIERLGNLLAGLQHLSNTPLQSAALSIQLLKEKNPDSLPLIQSMERSFDTVARVNKILSACSTSSGQDSASNLEEFEEDIQEIGKYLKT